MSEHDQDCEIEYIRERFGGVPFNMGCHCTERRLRAAIEFDIEIWELALTALAESEGTVARVPFAEVHKPIQRLRAALATKPHSPDS